MKLIVIGITRCNKGSWLLFSPGVKLKSHIICSHLVKLTSHIICSHKVMWSPTACVLTRCRVEVPHLLFSQVDVKVHNYCFHHLLWMDCIQLLFYLVSWRPIAIVLFEDLQLLFSENAHSHCSQKVSWEPQLLFSVKVYSYYSLRRSTVTVLKWCREPHNNLFSPSVVYTVKKCFQRGCGVQN